MAFPILTTRLFFPQVPGPLVARERLAGKMRQGIEKSARLVLVCAPAGFRKSTLVYPWAETQTAPVVRDDDTGRKSVASDTATVIAAPAAFQVSADNADFTLIAGESANLNLTVSTGLSTYPVVMVGVTEVYSPAGVLWSVEPVFETLTPTVALAVSETPDGINLDLADDLVDATEIVVPVTISTSASLPGGVYTATLVGRSDGVEVNVPLHFTIQEPDFTLSASAPTLSLSEDGNASLTFSAAALFGSTNPVHLSVSGVPIGMIRGLTPATIAPNGTDTATLSLKDTALLPNGSYILTVTGEDGLHTHSVDVTITVAKPGFSLATVDRRKLAKSGHES